MLTFTIEEGLQLIQFKKQLSMRSQLELAGFGNSIL